MFLIISSNPDVLDDVQNTGWETASEPQTRTSRTEQPDIAVAGGLSLSHYFIESYGSMHVFAKLLLI